MKRLTAALLILLLSFLSSCTFTLGRDTNKHYGKYPEYFSIVINSLLGVSGNEFDKIEILEQDSKGRTMFAFISKVANIDDKPGFYSIMICQKNGFRIFLLLS